MTTIPEQQIGIFTTDSALVVRSWDLWLAAVTGISSEQASQQSLLQLIPDFEQRGLHRRFERVLAEGSVEVLAPAFHRHLIQCAPLVPSRHYATMQQWVTIAPLREEDRIIGTIVTIEDVTARLSRERDLAEQLESPDDTVRLQAARALEAESQSAHVLVGAIGDTSWRVRQSAVSGLMRYGGAQAMVRLLQALRAEHQNPSVLNSALQVLALSELDVIAPLVECLRTPDTDLRIYAALALGERHDAAAIGALLEALQDPDLNVRYHAIESLGKLRAAEAVDALVSIAESRDFFLAFPAIDALSRIQEPRASARLIPLLEDELLRVPAAEALGQLSDQTAVAPLVALLNAHDAPALAIVKALTALYDRYEQAYGEGSSVADLVQRSILPAGAHHLLDALGQAQAGELRGLVLVLGWLEDAAAQRTLVRLLGQSAVRREVTEALVRHGQQVTGLLIEQLDAEDLETRQAAVVALGRIGDPRAVPALIRALGDDAELAVMASDALGAIGDRRAFDGLLALVRHPSAAVRQAAVGALNSLGHPDLAAETFVLLHDPDPYVRESGVKIAGYFGFENCVETVLACCADPDERVRRAAIEHLPYLDDPRVAETLGGALQSRSPGVRAAAARSLGQIEPKDARALLFAALGDPDPWVRYYASRSIGRHGYPEALDALAELARADPAIQVRIAAIEALGQVGGVQTTEFLAPYAVDSDADLRRAALKTLGMIKHADALPLIEPALSTPDPALRIDAIQALALDGSPGAVALLRRAALDEDEAVAGAAIQALAQVGTEEAIDALALLGADPERRERCVAALARLGEPQIELLARNLSHQAASVRSAMVEALAHMKQPRASAYVQTALEDQEAVVRLTAVRALSQLGSREAERQLVVLARADPDLAVRRAAHAALRR